MVNRKSLHSKYLPLLIITLLHVMRVSAQQATIDRQWYLAGEQLTVSVTMPDANIAYAELCDTHSLAAGTAISLVNGHGTGIIELPSSLHSGTYQLSVYQRGSSKVLQSLVAVVNPLYANDDDDITWTAADATQSASSVNTPQGTKTIYTEDLGTLGFGIPEKEGHIVMARITPTDGTTAIKADNIRTSLSIVGKQIHYFEGKMMNDSTAVFFTSGLTGRQPMVVSARSYDDTPLPVEIISPYATLLPESLPHLEFTYVRHEVEERSRAMQLHQIAITPAKKELIIGEQEADAATVEAEPMAYSSLVYGVEPNRSYNLDDYRQFATIDQTLTEYVLNVHRMKFNGRDKLAVYNEQEGYASWPAMVFIDGMPVNDIERLLRYDARRLHYINIYEDRYTFGKDMYKGILSFVTRTGRLTNYPTEHGAAYLVYDFPEFMTY